MEHAMRSISQINPGATSHIIKRKEKFRQGDDTSKSKFDVQMETCPSSFLP
jgi:hypothetical protein